MIVATADRIVECAAAVDAGGIVVLPTRRWYMLCADSTDERACTRLFVGKGRPATKPLALVMASTAAVEARFGLTMAARRLADAFWPGDLAMMLPWTPTPIGPAARAWWLGADDALVTRESGLLGELAARTRNPPATTVVSRSSAASAAERQPALTLAQVHRFIARTATPVDIAVDGGVCPLGRGLTVVDCRAAPRIVREGAIHARAIDAVLTDDEQG